LELSKGNIYGMKLRNGGINNSMNLVVVGVLNVKLWKSRRFWSKVEVNVI
jgi:hypothetical protein